uniref:Uncharacterized protein n=1 Tax=Pyxicephalus adspersus TaxID=30357 RepID=A0AAV3AIK1_PYXAD|nr:TPA: hypothetical protein GDO54_012654 [Pyxicephalus adspersus]
MCFSVFYENASHPAYLNDRLTPVSNNLTNCNNLLCLSVTSMCKYSIYCPYMLCFFLCEVAFTYFTYARKSCFWFPFLLQE